MIEAVYLMDEKPDLHLFTVSIEELVPMTIELSPNVKNAIPKIIEQIFKHTEELHLKS